KRPDMRLWQEGPQQRALEGDVFQVVAPCRRHRERLTPVPEYARFAGSEALSILRAVDRLRLDLYEVHIVADLSNDVSARKAISDKQRGFKERDVLFREVLHCGRGISR